MRHLPFRVLLPLAFVLCPLGACQTEENGVTDEQRLTLHREFARKYYDAGEMAQAERQADMGLEIDDKDEGLLLMKGFLRLKAGTRDDIAVAENVFRQLSKKADYRARLGLAETLERKGLNLVESAEGIEKGTIASESKDPVARCAELRTQSKAAWKESRETYLAVLGERPSQIQAINGLQRVTALEGDLEGSVTWAEKLLELATTEIEFWKTDLARPNLSVIEEGELRKRISASATLLVETHLTAASALVKLSRRPEALVHLTKAIEFAPLRSDLYSRRAQLQLDAGYVREAREDLRQFVKLSTLELDHPDMRRAYELLAECDRQLASVGG
ncbi:MAG: hypothetical protein NTV21_15885 [Planctomycetota bacterium]|nr:hypothetical protein [Planctomycetota bacterium]